MREHHPHPPHSHDGFDKRPGRERGGRGPRVFAPGDLKLLLPALIAEQPCHGYDLIRQIESLFDGAYTPSPGVIYPTLTFLEESELISGDAEGGKKRYTITDAGRLFLSEQAVALEGIRVRIDVSKRSLRAHMSRPPQLCSSPSDSSSTDSSRLRCRRCHLLSGDDCTSTSRPRRRVDEVHPLSSPRRWRRLWVARVRGYG